ncbi:hypothetical protein [Sphingobacterium litopenaei]|uniref:Uncharacterized protein n=1 Tax=Sphingobacterium litopenaei TaxID=2763500 RepID=A0ABR7YH12_9SPHI|nr:hypothetical protein [Sphingobacterium litopenaei]MBD1430604.1 hypothetical protein [Sphingobacterium litopenaei]
MRNHTMTEADFIEKFLPDDHNDQDLKYLKARYKWEAARRNEDSHKFFELASKTYNGTTFQKKHYPRA